MNYNFNPFSGVFDSDIEKTLVPIFNYKKIQKLIVGKEPIAIEFLGKQGRGKTSHLIYLHQRLSEFPIFMLNSGDNANDIFKHKSEVVFVDSIHHLSFLERVRLFKSKQVVVYTTHYSRKIDCSIAKKKIKSIRFKGITIEFLKEIITKRLYLASNNKTKNDFSDNELRELINKFGDNYRGIINYLYEKYQ